MPEDYPGAGRNNNVYFTNFTKTLQYMDGMVAQMLSPVFDSDRALQFAGGLYTHLALMELHQEDLHESFARQ